MARRVLHVANAYSAYANMSPAQLIQNVHDNMYKKFVSTAKGNSKTGAGSESEAKELQNFFQSLKYYAKYQSADLLATDVDLSVVQQVLTNMNSRISARRSISNLFRYTNVQGQKQGAVFESELASVVEEVLSMETGTSVKKGITNIGTSRINVDQKTTTLIDIDGWAAGIVESVGQTVYNKMKKMNTKFSEVSGKIDVSGMKAQVQITAKPNSYLNRIALLLSKANFSAKSYSSNYFDGRIKMRISKIAQEIHLGETDLRRVYTDIFTQEAGTPPAVSLSLYMYLKNTKNASLRTAASRLRFIYELTGYGQKYVNQAIQDILDAEGIGHANYFIYNDPGSDNIYVQSTAVIVAEMWNAITDLLENKSISLSKTFFSASASAFNDLL